MSYNDENEYIEDNTIIYIYYTIYISGTLPSALHELFNFMMS